MSGSKEKREWLNLGMVSALEKIEKSLGKIGRVEKKAGRLEMVFKVKEPSLPLQLFVYPDLEGDMFASVKLSLQGARGLLTLFESNRAAVREGPHGVIFSKRANGDNKFGLDSNLLIGDNGSILISPSDTASQG